jgi:hypothetical protein
MSTTSAAVGSAPPLQLAATLQLPPAVFVHETLAACVREDEVKVGARTISASTANRRVVFMVFRGFTKGAALPIRNPTAS